MRATDHDSGLTGSIIEKSIIYDPNTGIFTNARTRGGALKGAETGNCRPDQYWQIKINSRWYLAHRLAWVWMFGEWPKSDLDHINRDRSDNRIANLREATRSQNGINANNKKNNTSGETGVFYQKKCGTKHLRWRAYLTIDRKRINLGSFQEKEAAIQARREAELCYFGQFARGK